MNHVSTLIGSRQAVPTIEASDLVGTVSDRPVRNCLIHGDCRDILPELSASSVDLIHTSPPYNIDKSYKSSRDDFDHGDYVAFLGEVIGEAFRVLKPGRSLFFQVGYSEEAGPSREILPIDVLTFDIFQKQGFQLWDRIVWHYFGGMSFTRKFKNAHEIIMWWVKPSDEGDQPVFNVDAVREQSRSYDKRNNLWGRNPGNVWAADRVAFGGHKRSTSHIAVYPESITERIIRACSVDGDLILDPFAGSGTTPAVARSLGRDWLGCELSPEYVAEAASRIGRGQTSEWRTLVACLVRLVAFENKVGLASRDQIEERVERWLDTLRLDVYRQRYEAVFDSLRVDDRARRKAAKPAVWAHFDEALSGAVPEQKNLAIASAALDSVFGQRAAWNGLRKYRSLLDLLEVIAERRRTDGMSTIIKSVIDDAPSTFEAQHECSRVRLVAPPLKMRMHRGVRHATATRLREEQRELF